MRAEALDEAVALPCSVSSSTHQPKEIAVSPTSEAHTKWKLKPNSAPDPPPSWNSPASQASLTSPRPYTQSGVQETHDNNSNGSIQPSKQASKANTKWKLKPNLEQDTTPSVNSPASRVLNASGRPHTRPAVPKTSNGGHGNNFNGSARSSALSQVSCCVHCGSKHHPSFKCPGPNKCLACQNWKVCTVVISRTRLMKAMLAQGKFSRVESLYDSIIHDGHRPSLASCTHLLTALCKHKQARKAELKLFSMIEEGLEPDVVCYNCVINSFCEQGNMELAMHVYRFMKEKGCKPTASTFNTLIKGYGLAGKMQEAKLLLTEMTALDNKKAQPNVRTYNMLLNALCKNGKLDEARKLISSMQASGVIPDVITFNTMASAFAEKGLNSKAENVIREMQSLQLHPTEHTWGIVINGLCEESDVQRAMEFVKVMLAQGLSPNLVIFNTLVKGYAKALNLDGVDKVLEMIELSGLRPNLQTFSIMMDAWCSAGVVDKAKTVLERMREAGIPADITVYGILVKGYVRSQQPQDAELLVKEMREQRLTPNVVIYTTLISGWCNTGRMDNALRVYSEMVECKVAPNLRTFQTLVWGFCEAKRPEKAEEVLELMYAQCVLPDEKLLTMIADAWRVIGLHDQASRFLTSHNKGRQDMSSRMQPVDLAGHDIPSATIEDSLVLRSSQSQQELDGKPYHSMSQKQVSRIGPSKVAGSIKERRNRPTIPKGLVPTTTGTSRGVVTHQRSNGCCGYIRVAVKILCPTTILWGLNPSCQFCGQV